MVASPVSNARTARSRTGTPNPNPASNAADSSRARAYSTRAAQKATARPLTPIQTENLEVEGSEDEDEEQEGTQQAASSKDAASDTEEDRANMRRTSTRIAAKAAAREIAAQTAPSPPLVPKKLPKGRQAGATPSADTASSPGGTPAPLQDPTSLNKLADVASKVSKARKGPYNRSAPSAPTTRELLIGIEATGSADVVEVLVTDPNDMLAGYKQLEDWIYGGLDMYRVSDVNRQCLRYIC